MSTMEVVFVAVLLWFAAGFWGSARYMASQVRSHRYIAMECYVHQSRFFWLFVFCGFINLFVSELMIWRGQIQDNGVMIPRKRAREEAKQLQHNARYELDQEIERLNAER